MRNLKKILALVLALVMSLSLVTVANAAYSDAADIDAKYAEAVDVLTDLGVFRGTSKSANTFEPTKSITRAEVAAILYRINTGDVDDSEASLYKQYASKFFTDHIAAWAEPYVGYCANAEIYKGVGNSQFAPDREITGYEVLATMLRALGYDKNGEFTGKNWSIQTAATAQKLGITKDITSTVLAQPAQRQLVAELLLRTMLCKVVSYNAITRDYVEGTDTLAGKIFKMAKCYGVITGNEYADLKASTPMAAGRTQMGDYTINTTTTLADIGEMRYAYLIPAAGSTRYDLVTSSLYSKENGKDLNKVYENNGAEVTSIATLDGMTTATAQKYINYSNVETSSYTTNVRMEYVIETKLTEYAAKTMFYANGNADNSKLELVNADGTTTEVTYASVKAEALAKTAWDPFTAKDWKYTKSITAGSAMDPTGYDYANISTIFTKADKHTVYSVGEVYVYTTVNRGDVSDYMSFTQFVTNYLTATSAKQDITYNGLGNYLKAVDVNDDGAADYVMQTVYTVGVVSKIGSTTNIVVDKAFAASEADYVNRTWSKVVNDGEGELADGDVVIYASIDGNARAQLAKSATAKIDRVNRSAYQATTTDGTTYDESAVHTHNNVLSSYVDNLVSGTTYTLYFDLYGNLAAFTEGDNGQFVLLTDGWYNNLKAGAEYAVRAYIGGSLQMQDVTAGGSYFVAPTVSTLNNNWGALRFFAGIDDDGNTDVNSGSTDDIHTIVANLENGVLTPVDQVYRYSQKVAMIATANNAIPGAPITGGNQLTVSGTKYSTVYPTTGAYNSAALTTTNVSALSNTTYYYVYNFKNAAGTTINTGVREYVGYKNIPAIDAKYIEDVYAVGTLSRTAAGVEYYTANVVVVELNDTYATNMSATEVVFIPYFDDVRSGIVMEYVDMIRGTGEYQEDVPVNLTASTLGWYESAAEGIVGVAPGLYYMTELATAPGTYSIRPVKQSEMAGLNFLVGYISKSTATWENNWASVDPVVYNTVTGEIGISATDVPEAKVVTANSKLYSLSYGYDSYVAGYPTLTADVPVQTALAQNKDLPGAAADYTKSQYNELYTDGTAGRNEVLVAYNNAGEVIYAVSFNEYYKAATYVRDYAQTVWAGCLPAVTTISKDVADLLDKVDAAIAANTKADLEAALALVNAALAADPAPTGADKTALENAQTKLEAAIKALPAAKRTLTYTDNTNGLVTDAYVILTKADGTTDKTIPLTGTTATADIGEGICAVTVKSSTAVTVKVTVGTTDVKVEGQDLGTVAGQNLGWIYGAEIAAGTDAVTVTVTAKSDDPVQDAIDAADDALNAENPTKETLQDAIDDIDELLKDTTLTADEQKELNDKKQELTDAQNLLDQNGTTTQLTIQGPDEDGYYWLTDGRGPYATMADALTDMLVGGSAHVVVPQSAAITMMASGTTASGVTVTVGDVTLNADGTYTAEVTLSIGNVSATITVVITLAPVEKAEIRDTIAAAVKAAKEAAAKTDATAETLAAAKQALADAVAAETEELNDDEKAAVKEAEDAIDAAIEALATDALQAKVDAALKQADEAIAAGKLADLQAAETAITDLQDGEDELTDEQKDALAKKLIDVQAGIRKAAAAEGQALADALIAADEDYQAAKKAAADDQSLKQEEADALAALYKAAIAYETLDTRDNTIEANLSKADAAAVSGAKTRAETPNADDFMGIPDLTKASNLTYENVKDAIDALEAMEEQPDEWDWYVLNQKTDALAEAAEKKMTDTKAAIEKIQDVYDAVTEIVAQWNIAKTGRDADGKKYSDEEKAIAKQDAIDAYDALVAGADQSKQADALNATNWKTAVEDIKSWKGDTLYKEAADALMKAYKAYNTATGKDSTATATEKATATKDLYQATINYVKAGASAVDTFVGKDTTTYPTETWNAAKAAAKTENAEELAKFDSTKTNYTYLDLVGYEDGTAETADDVLGFQDRLTALEENPLEETLYLLQHKSDTEKTFAAKKTAAQKYLDDMAEAIECIATIIENVDDLVDNSADTTSDVQPATRQKMDAAIEAYARYIELESDTSAKDNFATKVGSLTTHLKKSNDTDWTWTTKTRNYETIVKGYVGSGEKGAKVTLVLLPAAKSKAVLNNLGNNEYELIFTKATYSGELASDSYWRTYLGVTEDSYYLDKGQDTDDNPLATSKTNAKQKITKDTTTEMVFKAKSGGEDAKVSVTVREATKVEAVENDLAAVQKLADKVFDGTKKVPVKLTNANRNATALELELMKKLGGEYESTATNPNTATANWGCSVEVEVASWRDPGENFKDDVTVDFTITISTGATETDETRTITKSITVSLETAPTAG